MTRTNKKISSNTLFKGVHLHTNTGKYEARFTFGKEQTYIGSYPTSRRAYNARKRYIMSLI